MKTSPTREISGGWISAMFINRLMQSLLIFGLLALTTIPMAFAKQKAGEVIVLQGTVAATLSNGQRRLLKRKSPVFETDVVETGKGSFVVLRFLDKTKISLRANSEFSINRFKTAKGEENVSLELLKGGLRALSGVIGKNTPRKFRIKGQRGQIGIRGTEFDVRECLEDCAKEQAELLGLALSEVNIKPGMYAAVYTGGITGFHTTGTLDADPGQAIYFSKKGMTLLKEIPLFLSRDPTPKASSGPDSTSNWANDYANDLELGALEGPVLQPVPVPGVEASGLPAEPIYEQQPLDAQSDFQPALDLPEAPTTTTRPSNSNTSNDPTPDVMDTAPDSNDDDNGGGNNTPDPAPPIIIL